MQQQHIRQLAPSSASAAQAAPQLLEMSAAQVGELLTHIGLGKYVEAFAAFPVDGACLAVADSADLEEAGMSAAMHRSATECKRVAKHNEAVPSNTMQHNIMQRSTTQSTAAQCKATSGNARECKIMQCTAMKCNTMHSNAMQHK